MSSFFFFIKTKCDFFFDKNMMNVVKTVPVIITMGLTELI